ncbi:MAG TPA: hypothetical protein VH681_02790 [Nitrospiraceae bacterium]|jgi:hypothetical protein
MDWTLLIGLLVLLIAGGAGGYHFYCFALQTKQAFRNTQPDLRISNLSAMNSGTVLTLSPEIENVGRGIAYDCVMHVGGWEGSFAVKKVHPYGPRHQKHVASIVLGPDSQIRAKPMANGYLWIRYRDCWGQKYECWYGVSQVKDGLRPLYHVQIDLQNPGVTEPTPSFWEMRKLLRQGSLYD